MTVYFLQRYYNRLIRMGYNKKGTTRLGNPGGLGNSCTLHEIGIINFNVNVSLSLTAIPLYLPETLQENSLQRVETYDAANGE